MKNRTWSPTKRSNRSFRTSAGVFRKTAPRGVPRRGGRPGLRLPDEQLQAGRRDNVGDLQEKMADRAVLQVDKAELPDQGLPGDKREHRDGAGMGRARPFPAGRLHKVPGQGQNQHVVDHGAAQGAPDGQKPADGVALA